MSQILEPILSAMIPDNGPGRMPGRSIFEVPGSADGSNPLYNRNLGVTDRLTRGLRYLEQHCQAQARKIQSTVDGASKEAALRDLIPILKFVIELQNNGPEVIQKIDLLTVKALMGTNVVGPEAKIFEGRDFGVVPALPDNIVNILKSRCELSNDGKTVAKTHRLVLVPASIDEVPTSINSLRKFAAEYGRGRDPAFNSLNWFAKEKFANRALLKSRWVLMYGTMAPNTGSRNDTEQQEAIKGYRHYKTVGALDAIATLVFGYLEHWRRDFSDVWCRTADLTSSGSRIDVGNFNTAGLLVNDGDGLDHHVAFGRAVCRRFK